MSVPASSIDIRQDGRNAFRLNRNISRFTAISISSVVFALSSAHATSLKNGNNDAVRESVQIDELNSLDSESLAERLFPDIEPPAPDSTHANLAGVVKTAETMIGIPYRWGGSTPDEGLDCSGFVRYVYQKVTGARLPRLSAQISKEGKAVAQPDLKPGDLVFFNTYRGDATHVGIYVGAQQFIHAPKTGAFIRVESMKSAYWTSRYYGARRVSA